MIVCVIAMLFVTLITNPFVIIMYKKLRETGGKWSINIFAYSNHFLFQLLRIFELIFAEKMRIEAILESNMKVETYALKHMY